MLVNYNFHIHNPGGVIRYTCVLETIAFIEVWEQFYDRSNKWLSAEKFFVTAIKDDQLFVMVIYQKYTKMQVVSPFGQSAVVEFLGYHQHLPICCGYTLK